MEASRLVSYRNWAISIHCEQLKNDGNSPKYAALGILTMSPGAATSPNKQDGNPPAVIHFASVAFSTSKEANDAILVEAMRQIDLHSAFQ
jgi:hypothetical protein